ncbi:MAG: hypothetical protein AAF363_16120 [Bacteroidota bacterium]
MRILYLLVLGLCLQVELFSQVERFQLIELRDGTRFKRVSAEFQENDCSYAFYHENDTLSIKPNEVIRMIPFSQDHFKGISQQFGIGLLSGERSVEKVHSFSAFYGLSYGLNQYAVLGVFSGIDLYDDFDIIPVTLRVQSFFTKTQVSPFFYFGSGYGWTFNEAMRFGQEVDGSGGLILETGTGLNVHLQNVDVSISLGYKRQSVELVFGDLEEFGSETVEDRTVNRLSLQIGFTF